MNANTIMQMEIHPELIRLRKERTERNKFMWQGAQNAFGSPFAQLLGGIGGLSGLGNSTQPCPHCGWWKP